MQKIVIGYQGEKGSNSEAAAKQFVASKGWDKEEYEIEYELVPLVTARDVRDELKRGDIDYGVFATYNTIGKTVTETYEAIKDEFFEFVQTIILQIDHCIYIKKGVDIERITKIASHIQAIEQTKKSFKRLLPNVNGEIEEQDTASAARRLSEGKLGDECAVICRKEAGELYNLELVEENVEDNENNQTEFRIFKRPEIDYSEDNSPTNLQRISHFFMSENVIGLIIQGITVGAIFIALLLAQRFSMGIWDAATTVGGYVAVLIIFLTSRKLIDGLRYRTLIGYWKYYSNTYQENTEDDEQRFITPRIVKISEKDNQLTVTGYISDKENDPMFNSIITFVSPAGKQKGNFVYTYDSPKSYKGKKVKGIVHLQWEVNYRASTVNIMRGNYYGDLSNGGDQGTLTYLRISEEEFYRHKNSTFLTSNER